MVCGTAVVDTSSSGVDPSSTSVGAVGVAVGDVVGLADVVASDSSSSGSVVGELVPVAGVDSVGDAGASSFCCSCSSFL